MATPALDRLLNDALAEPVDAQGLTYLLADPESMLQLLLFTGDPAHRPEVQDVAVVLRELKRQYGGLIRIGVIARADETRLQAAFDVRAFPSLVLCQQGEARDVIPRIQDWAIYGAKVRSWLSGALGAGSNSIPSGDRA
jgi:hydrogenase-1 operon protein HyaE